MSLQSRSVLFWQILNTRVCRTCSHFTAFSDNKFYSPHKQLFESYPDTSSLRKLLAWATKQYLSHCYGKTSASNGIQFTPPNPTSTAARAQHFRLTEKSSLRLQALSSHLSTLFMWINWQWRSPASEQTKNFVWLHKQSHRHQRGFGITSLKGDRSFNCLHGKILHYLIIHELQCNQLLVTVLSPPALKNVVF